MSPKRLTCSVCGQQWMIDDGSYYHDVPIRCFQCKVQGRQGKKINPRRVRKKRIR